MVVKGLPPYIPPTRGPSVPASSKNFLWQRILQRIRLKGPMNYRELLEILLYEPEHGFYTRYLSIGKGDKHHFSTRPLDFSPDYGRAFARRLVRFIELLKLEQGDLDLVALGDGSGVLFRDILQELQQYPPLYRRLKKTSIELVPRFCEVQKGNLKGLAVNIKEGSAVDLDQHFDQVRGIFYAHELIDQLPVHRVVWRGGVLLERYITATRRNRLTEIDGRLSDPEIEEYFKVIGKYPRDKRPCVVNLNAFKLLRNLSRILRQGAVFIIDYNTGGTKLNRIGYSRFGRSTPLIPKTLFNAIGRDITTDVDFEALRLIARHFGFEVLFEDSELDFLRPTIPSHLWPMLGEPVRVLALAKRT